jgi:hypothetical protein
VGRHRLGQDVGDRHPRVERGDRVLEHDLDVAAQRFPAGAVERRHVVAEHLHATHGRGRQVQDLKQRAGLAASRLADQAEDFALADVEGDAVDGVDRTHPATQQGALGEGVVLGEVLDGQHDWSVAS